MFHRVTGSSLTAYRQPAAGPGGAGHPRRVGRAAAARGGGGAPGFADQAHLTRAGPGPRSGHPPAHLRRLLTQTPTDPNPAFTPHPLSLRFDRVGRPGRAVGLGRPGRAGRVGPVGPDRIAGSESAVNRASMFKTRTARRPKMESVSRDRAAGSAVAGCADLFGEARSSNRLRPRRRRGAVAARRWCRTPPGTAAPVGTGQPVRRILTGTVGP